MLNLAVRNTGKLIREKSKSDNVRLGRLFTKKDTARLMADMAALDKTKSTYTVLDIGAGTGILSAAIIEKICKPTCMLSSESNLFADIGTVAKLPLAGGIILILISMLLTFIAGLFPSRFAAKRNPVEALRSE